MAENEQVLGINPDSVGLVSVVVAVSIGLAVAVAFRPSRPRLWTIVALMLLFATFDAAEVAHQIDERNNGVAIIAGVVAALHVAAAVLAYALVKDQEPSAVHARH